MDSALATRRSDTPVASTGRRWIACDGTAPPCVKVIAFIFMGSARDTSSDHDSRRPRNPRSADQPRFERARVAHHVDDGGQEAGEARPEAADIGLRQVARADLDDRTIAHRIEDFEHHGTVLHLNLLALTAALGVSSSRSCTCGAPHNDNIVARCRESYSSFRIGAIGPADLHSSHCLIDTMCMHDARPSRLNGRKSSTFAQQAARAGKTPGCRRGSPRRWSTRGRRRGSGRRACTRRANPAHRPHGRW